MPCSDEGKSWATAHAGAFSPGARKVKLASGGELAYDRLILSPGIDIMSDTLPGLAKPGAQDKVLHAWKAGPQTLALRRQLEDTEHALAWVGRHRGGLEDVECAGAVAQDHVGEGAADIDADTPGCGQ